MLDPVFEIDLPLYASRQAQRAVELMMCAELAPRFECSSRGVGECIYFARRRKHIENLVVVGALAYGFKPRTGLERPQSILWYSSMDSSWDLHAKGGILTGSLFERPVRSTASATFSRGQQEIQHASSPWPAGDRA